MGGVGWVGETYVLTYCTHTYSTPTSVSLVEKVVYLGGEDKWVVRT